MVFSIVFALVAVYCVFSGIKIIFTGSLSAKEEAKLSDFSNKGARTYKLVYAITNILGGLGLLAFSVVRFLESLKILDDTLPFLIGILVFAVVLVVVLLIARSRCKAMTDDE